MNNEDQKDGFDGVIIRINKVSKKVTYAAANNHPVVIANSVLTHLDYDKMPVGKGEKLAHFTQFEIVPESNSAIYIYTDGYADQFGGIKGKKFKYKQLNGLLLTINQTSFINQKEVLSQTFKNWQGNLEQVDDICIMGIQV